MSIIAKALAISLIKNDKGFLAYLLMVTKKILDELFVLPRLVAFGKQVEVLAAGVPDVVLQLVVLHFATV